MQYLRKSTAVTIMFGPFVDKADGVTLKTDATTITDIDHASTGIFLSKAGAAAAIRHANVTASVADAYGMMKVTLDTTDTNTTGTLDVLFAKAATYLPVNKEFMVLEQVVYDVLFGTVALATATNITAGTITTVTNLTNAPTAGDLTATMKTSVTTAASSSTPTVTLANGAHGGAAATMQLGGAGGLTATHTGNTTGSVGSVTGAVGSVTGAVGSVTAGVTLAASQHVIVDSGTVTAITNTVNADVKKINGTTITGDGSATPFNV